MIALVECTKCGATGKIDCGEDVTTAEAAQALIDKNFLGSPRECPFGHHVELSGIKYTVTGMEEGHAPTDEEWLEAMRAKGLDLWTTDELYKSPIEITAFAYGFPVANINGQSVNLDFATSPDGKRYYYMNHEEYERLTAASR